MTVNVGSITPSATYNKGKVLIVAVNAQADAQDGPCLPKDALK